MNRLQLFLFLAIFGGLVGCGSDEIREIANHTTELQIMELDTAGVPIATAVITDRNEIRHVLAVITNSEAPTFKCGHDYELHCKTSDNKIVVIELNSDNLCANASFIYDGELMFRYIDNESLDRLKTLLN